MLTFTDDNIDSLLYDDDKSWWADVKASESEQSINRNISLWFFFRFVRTRIRNVLF